MENTIIRNSAKFVSWVFSPLLVPSLGFVLLMNHIPGVEFYSFRLKMVLLAVVVFSSCLLPLLYSLISALNHRLLKTEGNKNNKVMLSLFTALSLFVGAQFLSKLPVAGVFRILLFGACLLTILLFLISFRWNISEHTFSLGGLWGALIALNFRYGMDLVPALLLISIIAGITASAKIFLEHHSDAEIYTGFVTGASVMFTFLILI